MKVIAHRGFSENYPENSLIAFDKAIEAGVDGIETDIRLSSDGVPFIFHDSSLKRITGQETSLESQPSSYLQDLDIGSWFDTAFSDQRMPTLKRLLEHIDGRTKMILEIKYDPKSFKELCNSVVVLIEDKLDWIEVSSFSDEILFNIHTLNAKVRLHKLIDEVKVLEKRKFESCYSFVSYFDIDVNLKEHTKAQELIQNHKVVFWTVGDEDISSSVALGLYGAMSNDPTALKKFV